MRRKKLPQEVPLNDEGELKASIPLEPVSSIRDSLKNSGAGDGRRLQVHIHFCVTAGCNFSGFLAQNLL